MIDWDTQVQAAEKALNNARASTTHVGACMFAAQKDGTLHLGNRELDDDLDATVMIGVGHAEHLLGVLVQYLDPRALADLMRWARDFDFDPTIVFSQSLRETPAVRTHQGFIRVDRTDTNTLLLQYSAFEGFTVLLTITPYDLIDLVKFVGDAFAEQSFFATEGE